MSDDLRKVLPDDGLPLLDGFAYRPVSAEYPLSGEARRELRRRLDAIDACHMRAVAASHRVFVA